MNRIIYTAVIILLSYFCYAQNHYDRFESIDVQHYSFEIHLNDTSDRIEGKTDVSIKFLKPLTSIQLDMVNKAQDKGMEVSSVLAEGEKLKIEQTDNALLIQLKKAATVGQIIDFQIKYAGIPADGLVISKNRHGQRTFFGDNWPDRTGHWLPTVDHPSDKASVEFKVFAPSHYKVVSNGVLIEQIEHKKNITYSHWKESTPIPTKLMVIGVADFAVGNEKEYEGIPVSSWVFDKDKAKGFQNYRYGTEALEYFSELIGPYPYAKLAHVQSKTRYGGMENASCIFYHEGTATGEYSQEGLFAHEVAHQWFGNSVTEQNWHHVWLSEGFATYLTHVYMQNFYGEETFRKGLERDRSRVINYAKQHLSPVIDTTVTDYIRLLNANSYQKASWFLHMLRIELGDEIFFKGLQKYYADYKNSTALTSDFLSTMESVSGKDLKTFFEQWLWQPGHPVIEWKWRQASGKLHISAEQITEGSTFSFALDIQVLYENGVKEKLRVGRIDKKLNVSFDLNGKVKDVILDPEIKLLFEEKKLD